jgi:hypothetical protein
MNKGIKANFELVNGGCFHISMFFVVDNLHCDAMMACIFSHVKILYNFKYVNRVKKYN